IRARSPESVSLFQAGSGSVPCGTRLASADLPCDRVSSDDDPGGLEHEESPLAINVGRHDQQYRPEPVRDQVSERRRWRDLEMEERERSHVEQRSDNLDELSRVHVWWASFDAAD